MVGSPPDRGYGAALPGTSLDLSRLRTSGAIMLCGKELVLA